MNSRAGRARRGRRSVHSTLTRLPAWVTSLAQTILTLLTVTEEGVRRHVLVVLEQVLGLLRRQCYLVPGEVTERGRYLESDSDDDRQGEIPGPGPAKPKGAGRNKSVSFASDAVRSKVGGKGAGLHKAAALPKAGSSTGDDRSTGPSDVATGRRPQAKGKSCRLGAACVSWSRPSWFIECGSGA